MNEARTDGNLLICLRHDLRLELKKLALRKFDAPAAVTVLMIFTDDTANEMSRLLLHYP